MKRKRNNMAGSSSCGTKTNTDVDFLSSLPDEVLTIIFSFLTMKEALYTCISCKKLKHLMTLIPNVEFEETKTSHRTYSKGEFVVSVSRFLDNHDSHIKKFRLSFNPLKYRYSRDVCYWLSLVLKNCLEELDLVFNGNMMELPELFPAENLKVLKLRHCALNLPSITCFKSLKSLLLGSMCFTDCVLKIIFRCCESLQHLTLENCTGFTNIEFTHPKSKLETLILNDCHNHLALKVLSLKTLFIGQKTMNFFFVGSPHINNLILFRQTELPITQQESQNMKNRIIARIGNVRSLQLSGRAFECFTAFPSNRQLKKLENIRLLDFNVCLCNIKGLTYMISQADRVKKLHISINENTAGNHETYNTDRDFERILEHFLDNNYTLPPTVAFRNSAVRIINIQSFTGTLYEWSHIKFMLAHFPRLRHLEVTPIKEMDEEQSRTYALLISSFPILSAYVDVVMGSMKFKICRR